MNGLVPEARCLLVAPWYRWGAEGVGTGGMTVRDTWPAFQKYATPSPAGEFVKAPQHSLKFFEEEDRYELATVPVPPLGKLPSPLDGVQRRLADHELVKTTIRKLYLDTHKRFYLVVVQLIWDQPGYPCVDRAHICQQGFVVRRRGFKIDKGSIDAKGIEILGSVLAERARRQYLTRFIDFVASSDVTLSDVVDDREAISADDLIQLQIDAADQELGAALAREQKRLREWAQGRSIEFLLDGWVPGPHPNLGGWESIDDTPADLKEMTYPLYPLVADPDDSTHDGHDSSIYFGLIPTGGSDVAEDGTARFDDRSLYEIRCFVRRHDKRCPRTDKVPDCAGPLVWSAPSETYRLAAQFDLTGTSNHQVTVQAPDFPALAAKVAALAKARPAGAPPPAVGGVRVVTPPKSSFNITATTAGMPTAGGIGDIGEICVFMIPFFTIIALFLVNLVLPILMLIFGLGWMLALKFCFPPSVSADVTANLSLELIGLTALSVNPSLDLSVDDQMASMAANVTFRTNTLLPHLKAEFGDEVGAHTMTLYSTDALYRLHQAMAAGQAVAQSPKLSDRLQFEDLVVRSQVVFV